MGAYNLIVPMVRHLELLSVLQVNFSRKIIALRVVISRYCGVNGLRTRCTLTQGAQ